MKRLRSNFSMPIEIQQYDQHYVEGWFYEGDLVWLYFEKEQLKGEGKKLKLI